MIKPQTFTENMMFNTIKLETQTGSGTGFFFEFKISDNKFVPVIFTNKHVVNNNQTERVRFSLHVKENGLPEGNIEIDFIANWFFHESFDLCFCFAQPIFEQIKINDEKDIFFVPINEEIIWDNTKLEELSTLEDVVMVGYPIGLFDDKNNLPLFRKGVTSTHPSIDFDNKKLGFGKGIGVIDVACFPGSSGSPIFIYNEFSYLEKNSGYVMGNSREIFLGVLFSGPNFNAEGEIIVEKIPTQNKVFTKTPQMINLGFYIKASAILDFKPMIEGFISKQQP